MPAVELALKDTSSDVRQAAVTALGEIGGDRAITLARTALNGDSSYQVRSAAIATLAQLDSANRRAVITQGLALPSYQDVIATAALRAIARSNDTSFIGPVERTFGELRAAPHVLGVLANQGSVRALDVLTRHLDDERSYVRRWVLQAFRSTVRRDLAVAKLRAVEPTLRYPDTQKRRQTPPAARGAEAGGLSDDDHAARRRSGGPPTGRSSSPSG